MPYHAINYNLAEVDSPSIPIAIAHCAYLEDERCDCAKSANDPLDGLRGPSNSGCRGKPVGERGGHDP